MKKNHKLAIWIDQELKAKLVSRAEATGETLSEYCRKVLSRVTLKVTYETLNLPDDI